MTDADWKHRKQILITRKQANIIIFATTFPREIVLNSYGRCTESNISWFACRSNERPAFLSYKCGGKFYISTVFGLDILGPIINKRRKLSLPDPPSVFSWLEE